MGTKMSSAAPDAKYFEVNLIKDPQLGLGLTLVDGEFQGLKGVYVKSVTAGSPADVEGKLRVGDQVIKVNGVTMEGKTRLDVVNLVRESTADIAMEIMRLRCMYSEEEAAVSPSPNENEIVTSIAEQDAAEAISQLQLTEVSKSMNKSLELLYELDIEPNEIVGNTIIDIQKNQTLVHYVCQNGNAEVLKEILQQECDLECKSTDLGNDGYVSYTPLHLAASQGHSECLKLLIEAGTDVNSTTFSSCTPVHCAIRENRLNCLKQLIAHGANIHAKSEGGFTPIHIAAQCGHVECLNELCSYGADVNARNDDGCTPLHAAAYWGQSVCLKALIEAGSNPRLKNSNGFTAVDVAIAAKKIECAEYLKMEITRSLVAEFGASIKETLKIASELNIVPDEIFGNTVIDESNDLTLLHFVCENGSVEALKELLRQKCDLECKATFAGTNGSFTCTPLQLVALKGHEECLRLLIEAGADVNRTGSDLWTPLHYAACGDHLNCLIPLIAHEANIQAKDKGNSTPLHIAAGVGSLDCLKELIAKGSDVSALNDDNDTALHCAAFVGHLDCLRSLIEAGANPNIKNNDDKTALDIAVDEENTECAEYLKTVTVQNTCVESTYDLIIAF